MKRRIRQLLDEAHAGQTPGGQMTEWRKLLARSAKATTPEQAMQEKKKRDTRVAPQRAPHREVREGCIQCAVCEQWRPLTQYYQHRRKDGRGRHLSSYCDGCRKARYVMRNHVLTHEQYQSLMKKSAGNCGICAKVLERPNLDHDHKTGKMRGVLCRRCNSGIGIFEDDPTMMRAAAEYVAQWREQHALVRQTPTDVERAQRMAKMASSWDRDKLKAGKKRKEKAPNADNSAAPLLRSGAAIPRSRCEP